MYTLPTALQQAIQAALTGYTPAALRVAGESLTASYRQTKAPGQFHQQTNLDRAAYLLTRLPAIYAAVCAALHELRARAPQAQIASLLDLGAGPGTVPWAAGAMFPHLKQVTLIENDVEFIAAGRSLAQSSTFEVVRRAVWQRADLRAATLEPHDLITISYALNELDALTQTALIQRAWPVATQFLAIIEPGTKTGFANILRARQELLQRGAFILAPCPHADACPMAAQDDWCHFAQRLARTAQHRHAKNAALGYEDEKFSYLIASRQPVTPAPTRIVRHPLKLKGHVKLTICAPEGVRQEVVTAKTKEVYKNARKAEWGDAWTSL